MGKIYKKTTTYSIEENMIMCDKCGLETAFCMAIDAWCGIDGESYCLQCQEKYKVGHFESKK
jgi:hypothetical protein